MKTVKERVHYWCKDTLSRKVLGQGVGVAILDTGISRHPDFDYRIAAFCDFIHNRRNPYDDSDHGTHVAGILAGSGKASGGVYSGIAPQAHLIVIKVLDQDGDGSIGEVIKGIQWILAHRYEYQIRVVNISIGTKPNAAQEGSELLIKKVEQLWDAGLIVMASAGNYGPKESSVAIPGVSKKIITVGALDGEKVLGCSGRGPTKECVIKPEILAPGANIISCQGKWYAAKSGTSMATPIVSGAAALLLSKYPEMSNVEVKLRLRETMEENRKLNVERLLNTHM